MKRIGIIGCGRIGRPLVKAIQSGQAGENSLIAVLTRTQRKIGDLVTDINADVFFNKQFDLIIDVAEPVSLKHYGVRALSMTDLWSVNATALADTDLYAALENAGREHGHRLRLLPGAIAGLEGVAAMCVDTDAQVHTIVDVAPGSQRKVLFKGNVRDAALLFPDCVNVAVATSLSGSGLDHVQVEVVQPGPDEDRTLSLFAKSKYGLVEAKTIPVVIPPKDIHMVAASIIAALRRENEVVWVG